MEKWRIEYVFVLFYKINHNQHRILNSLLKRKTRMHNNLCSGVIIFGNFIIYWSFINLINDCIREYNALVSIIIFKKIENIDNYIFLLIIFNINSKIIGMFFTMNKFSFQNVRRKILKYCIFVKVFYKKRDAREHRYFQKWFLFFSLYMILNNMIPIF